MSERTLDQADLLQLVIGALELCETGVLIHNEHTILYANARLAKQIETPADLTRSGGSVIRLIDFCASRGDYGVGVSGAEIIARSLATTREGGIFETERRTPSGRWCGRALRVCPTGAPSPPTAT